MKILILFTVLFYNAAVDALLNGHPVYETQHPYVVSIQAPVHYCGGTIVSKSWILTAASCIDELNPNEVKVKVGSILRNCPNSGIDVSVKELVKHDGFDRENLYNDIGMILLRTQLNFTQMVNKIQLPISDNIKPNTLFSFIGWGKLRHRGRMPNVLQKADLKVYNQTICRHMIHYEEHPICTYTSENSGACDYDQGGPLVQELLTGHFIIGIFSRGYAPCGGGLPDVFTQVFEYKDWIRGLMEIHV